MLRSSIVAQSSSSARSSADSVDIRDLPDTAADTVTDCEQHSANLDCMMLLHQRCSAASAVNRRARGSHQLGVSLVTRTSSSCSRGLSTLGKQLQHGQQLPGRLQLAPRKVLQPSRAASDMSMPDSAALQLSPSSDSLSDTVLDVQVSSEVAAISTVSR